MESTIYPPGSQDARDFSYGDIRSLHSTLDGATAAQLEEAILCCHLRDFEPALAIFNDFPSKLRVHPVIAYYHSQAYWLQWLHFKGANVLQEAQAAADDFVPQFRDSGVYTLLRMCRGLVQYYAEGHFTLAREAMIRSWLSHVPIEEYTDIQVSYRQRGEP